MRPLTPHPYRLLAYTLAMGVVALQAPFATGQTPQTVVLELRPHCEEMGWTDEFGGPVPENPFMTTLTKTTCPEFEIRDPNTRQTPVLRSGTILDMDLVVRNPSQTPISRVRAWIAYDPALLTGEDVTLHPAFTMPTPGEQTFSAEDGFVKIGASTDNPLTGDMIPVARIRMRAEARSDTQTVLSFYKANGQTSDETAVVTGQAPSEQSLLQPPVGQLLVRLTAGVSGAAASSEPQPVAASSAPVQAGQLPSVVDVSALQNQSMASSSAASSATSLASDVAPPVSGDAFRLLQVQNLRATTDQSIVYLAWDALRSAELLGYNVYYGAVSGEYLHRKSLDRTATTLTLRDLPVGVRMYFAVRGFNAANEETEFSQEVAVIIGQPQTSTSPLLASALPKGPQGKAPGTSGSIAGDTGSASTLLLFVLASAAIGTLLAFRRQFVASARLP